MARTVMQTGRAPELSAARHTFSWGSPRGLARAKPEARKREKTCYLW